jgi:hypothetical protein
MKVDRRIATVAAVSCLAIGGVVPSAWGWENEKQHCNAGNGNGSEEITFEEGAHCFGGDPGNSFNAGNKGGDEIPTSGGVPNPGGNNVP